MLSVPVFEAFASIGALCATAFSSRYVFFKNSYIPSDEEDGLVYALVPVVRALGRMRIRDEFAVLIGSCISCVC